VSVYVRQLVHVMAKAAITALAIMLFVFADSWSFGKGGGVSRYSQALSGLLTSACQHMSTKYAEMAHGGNNPTSSHDETAYEWWQALDVQD